MAEVTSEQWFSFAPVFLLISLSAFGCVALIFVGAATLDLIDKIKKRTGAHSSEITSGPTEARKRRTPIFVPKPAAHRQYALTSAGSTAAEDQDT